VIWRLNSLRWRLFAAIAVVVVLSVGLALAIGAMLVRREAERSTLRSVARQADVLAQAERDKILAFSQLESLNATLALQDERVEKTPLDGSSRYLPEPDASAIRGGRRVQGRITLGGREYFYAARKVHQNGLVLLRPTSAGATAARPYVEGLAVAALAGAILAGVISFLLARAISRPVGRVAEASRSLAHARSPTPVPVEGARELALLASSFNEMALQLAKAREAERSFLLSVSHELKTPLTAIRGYAEGVDEGAVPVDEAAETIVREAARLERLVRDLLDLARMNRSEFSVHEEEIDLAAAAHEAVARYDAQARAFGVTLEAFAPLSAPAVGDADRALQVVSNLVENALRVTPPGGVVRVVAEPGKLIVEDTGPGLQPDELPRAFDRFFLYSRYGGERPVGTGLGLAIVKTLTEGMKGTVEVESEPGRLTRFIVRLPSSRARAPAERTLVGA
jgi:two-component system sensor histidine kinase BaeS